MSLLICFLRSCLFQEKESSSSFSRGSQGVYMIRWDFDDYFLFHWVQCSLARVADAAKLLKSTFNI
jgi:hypothetical protein